MRAIKVMSTEIEAFDMVTLYFEDDECTYASPGQYVMVWIPGVKEIPMSLSNIRKNGIYSVSVRSVGRATRALCSLSEGDIIGLRGPFGNGYKIVGKEPLLIGGGSGVASLVPLTEILIEKEIMVTFVLAAKTENELIFRNRLESLLGENLFLATDDGSCGFEGFGSECAFELMNKNNFDNVYTCGPELMMATVFKEVDSKGIPVQASLERYIKCAEGLCGSCAIGPYRVCKDGPVFNSCQLRQIYHEFGKSKLDPCGRVVPIDE
jgi:dihydroorotate dehydrogenase electron transfer subunit